jgi:two-component system chemotaxis response regulator CheB
MRRNLIVIGASAGGVEALQAVAAGLPAELDACVLIVLHVPTYGGSVLPAILARAGMLPALHPDQEQELQPGTLLVAPPDNHLVVDDGRALLTRGPRENGHRPAIDVLFRSAARSAGQRVIGVVLSGVLDDGTAGLSAIAARGGVTVVQDPADALYPGMPTNALDNVAVDHVVAAKDIGPLLADLCAVDIAPAEDEAAAVSSLMEIEADLAMMDDDAMNRPDRPGVPSGFSCPDCAGVLWEIMDGGLIRYRCRVGHAWSAESLLGEQAQQLEGALWMALRGLEEKAALARTMRDRASERGNPLTAQRFEEQAEESARAASLIRSMLELQFGSSDDQEARA